MFLHITCVYGEKYTCNIFSPRLLPLSFISSTPKLLPSFLSHLLSENRYLVLSRCTYTVLDEVSAVHSPFWRTVAAVCQSLSRNHIVREPQIQLTCTYHQPFVTSCAHFTNPACVPSILWEGLDAIRIVCVCVCITFHCPPPSLLPRQTA